MELIAELDKHDPAVARGSLRGEVAERLRQEVAQMNVNNFIVRPKRRLVEKYADAAAWEALGLDERNELVGDVAGLPSELVDEDLEAKQFDLVEIAESALRIHAHRLSSGSIELRKDLPEQLMVKAMGGELLQVFSNFILNAMDALPEKDAVLCFRIHSDKERAHITISDNGHGIHPSVLKRLFEPYVTNKSSGTGVGLWLSKRIVDKHQGTIRFRSSHQPGKSGTTFRVSLPIAIER